MQLVMKFAHKNTPGGRN